MTDLRRIAIVTGSRADYGLLRPVIDAVGAEPGLRAQVVATGIHLLPPEETIQEVVADHPDAAIVPMQVPGVTGRVADARAFGRGVSGFTEFFASDPPAFVLVLGDRIEALAAGTAAALSGIRLVHIHGGDRAEGIADDSIRHAITRFAHLHCAASVRSAERIIAMGEDPWRTHVTGSPGVDAIDRIGPLDDDMYDQLGRPEIVVLLHPTGDPADIERTRADMLLMLACGAGRTLALDPNHDPGREGIVSALDAQKDITRAAHLPREVFIGLLRRIRLLAGNSSAGLLEAAAIPVRVIDIGSRQSGRERVAHVLRSADWEYFSLRRLFDRALSEPLMPFRHPFGDGNAGARIAKLLTRFHADNLPLAKRCTY